MKYPISALLAILLCISVTASGQDFKDGFIILNDGSYKYGNIKLNNSDLYGSCQFQINSTSEIKTYTPENINGYGLINSINYQTREIYLNGEQKKVFLRNEVSGITRLFSYNERFFAEKENFIELLPNSGDTGYRKVLSGLFQGCKDFSVYLARVKFSQQDLKEAFELYNTCAANNYRFIPHRNIHVEAFAGIEFNNTVLGSDIAELKFLNNEKFRDNTLLSVGVTATISFPKTRGVYASAGIFGYSQQLYLLKETNHTDHSSRNKINLDYTELSIPLNFQYIVTERWPVMQPYIKAGIAIPVTMRSSLTWESENEYTGAVYNEVKDLSTSFRQSIQMNFSVGAYFPVVPGIRGVIEAVYQEMGGEFATSSESIDVFSNRINIHLGVRFWQ